MRRTAKTDSKNGCPSDRWLRRMAETHIPEAEVQDGGTGWIYLSYKSPCASLTEGSKRETSGKVSPSE